MNIEKRLRAVGILLAGVVVVGTLGYVAIEKWSLLDSLFMTVITLATVGYQEVHPLSPAGRMFTIALIFLGVGATFYGLTLFIELLFEGHLRDFLERRRLKRGMRGMRDHYIICGYGRVGREVVNQLRRRDKQIVVVENRHGPQDELAGQNIINVPGDATDDRILIGAGVKTARALVITLPQEADNVLIALTARQLNPPLHIVARAEEDRNRRKLLLAGANTVVSPHEIGGLRMAIATVSPNVLDFMQVAGGGEASGSQIEEIEVGAGSRLCGVTLRDSPIMSELGLAVIGMRKAGGAMRLAPSAEETINPGDVLIVIGSVDRLATLRDLTAAPPVTVAIDPLSR